MGECIKLAHFFKMSCCAVNIKLGCVNACGNFQLPYYAPVTGTYTLLVEFAGVTRASTFSGAAGQRFTLDPARFNEAGLSVFQIILPNGDYFTATQNDVESQCFEIRLRLIYNDGPMEFSCCDPKIIKVLNSDHRVLTKADWLPIKEIPTVQVFYTDDEGHKIPMITQPVYDDLENPQTITVYIPGTLAVWYIKLS